jgi:hypothetical protein
MASRGNGVLLDVSSEAASDFGACFAMSRFDGFVELSVVELFTNNQGLTRAFAGRDSVHFRNWRIQPIGCQTEHNAAV